MRQYLRQPLIKLGLVAMAVTLVGAAEPDILRTLGPDLALARSIASGPGDRLWPGYGKAPFGMLLIAGDTETLLCQPDPPSDFKPEGRDRSTGCARLDRSRSGLPDNLLAAMPVFGPASTIVMGTPERTGFAKQDWLRTILHEHFHQWQTSRPGYFARVAALDLAGGDTSGMWMLNFAFPYKDPTIAEKYSDASVALAHALELRGKRGFGAAVDRFIEAHRTFAASAGSRNWRYLDFELWQEGGARWTEYAIAKAGSDPLGRTSAVAGEARTIARLRHPNLGEQGRDLVYTYGPAEIMLIDACSSSLRRDYPLATGLDPLLTPALTRCKFT